jgi:hypothetical protein
MKASTIQFLKHPSDFVDPVFKTHRKGVQIAEQQKSNDQEGIIGVVTEEQSVKCSRLYVLHVERQQRFHLGQPLKNQFITRIAINKRLDNIITC